MRKGSEFKDAVVLGLAVFAMFFGAGNLIFPPAIGLEGGTEWLAGYITYFLVDVGLALLSLAAMFRVGGRMEGVTGTVGKAGSVALNTAAILCIGPLLAIPRTAATSYEMGIADLLGLRGLGSFGLIAFAVVFFAVVLLGALKPSKVVDRVGGILTPVLVVTLAVLIVGGIVNPGAPAAEPAVDNLVQQGVLNGYQTMDMLAALAFSLVIVRTVREHNYPSAAVGRRVSFGACALAGVLLFLVYGGLAYLGATTGQLWHGPFLGGTLDQAGLLSNIAGSVLGVAGAVFLAIIVVFACLTTAIGLVSASAEYFSGLSGERVSYAAVAVIVTVASLLICTIGLSQIISIAAPILSLVYPAILFLTVMSLIGVGRSERKPAAATDARTSDEAASPAAPGAPEAVVTGSLDAAGGETDVAGAVDGEAAAARADASAERAAVSEQPPAPVAPNVNMTCVFGVIVALVVSLFGVLSDTFGLGAFAFVHALPLDAYGFGWLVPTVVAALVGFCVDRVCEARA